MLSPVITRIYGPEAYGIQGLFLSLSAILVGIGALSYPLAIVIAKDTDEIKSLIAISVFSSLALAIIIGFVFFLFGSNIFLLLQADQLFDLWYVFPLFVFLSGFCVLATQCMTKYEEFRAIAKGVFLGSVGSNSAKVILGFFLPTPSALVGSNLLGQLIVFASMLLFSTRKVSRIIVEAVLSPPQLSCLSKVARVYSDFPLLRTPQVFINSISQSLPSIFLAIYFGAEVVGYFSLAYMLLAVPTTLLGNSVMQVFYPKASSLFTVGGPLASLTLKATLVLAGLGLLPFLCVIVWGGWLFSFVFGEAWAGVASYSGFMCGWLYLMYISRPYIAIIAVIRKQRFFLVFELFATGAKLAALYYGCVVKQDPIATVGSYSLASGVSYLVLMFSVHMLMLLESAKDKA